MKSRDRRKRPARTAVPPLEPLPRDAGPSVASPPRGATTRRGSWFDADRQSGTGAGEAWLDRWFMPLALGILLVAAALRLPELALNPFHHDEGVNGFFTMNLVRNGTYVYDPANYHGPSLYYFAFLSEIVFGLTTEAMRLVPVLFGLLTVGLVFPLRRYLGSLAVLTAGGLLAVSPGAVYVSRYFIHEMLLVGLTLAVVVSAVFYIDRRAPRFLLGCAVSLALLFATKETGIITIAVLLIAVAIAVVYVNLRTPANRRATAGLSMRFDIPVEQLAAAAVVFLVIYVLLYSSFFTNFPKGLTDSLATFTIWAQHGESTQVQPLTRYFEWMIPLELPILILGTAGGLIAAIRGRHRLWVTVGLWAAGITAAYSIIQYKTPWIILNMVLPLALLAGLAISELWRSRFRLGAPIVLGAALVVSTYQAIDLNFYHYDDQAYAYVYVHSTRDMLNLVNDIEATADRAGTGKQTGIVFVTPDYWPLPWYFRDYPRAGFFGQIVDTQEAMIVANVNQEAELAPKVAGKYDRVGQFNLRPGVDLALYVRTDIPKS